ncbi:hypothetical protein [Kitasatospora paracochleata]|uniref:Uncharacterized protein n=1 Tax=Kitasatospora paracochleata TaxID=58354 RepID=A0ABT1JAP3_9ACTN|nr:hypothetical protein [Kitasatospora paracochleata]MCP2314529.1 hypothetical protein [Kitasatospora paracochleata]
MSAQPDQLSPLPPAPAPTAAEDRRTWWPQALERDGAARAMDDSSWQVYDLTPPLDPVRSSLVRLDSPASAVAPYVAGGMDDEDGIDLDRPVGTRP